jgi:hypothetical protein
VESSGHGGLARPAASRASETTSHHHFKHPSNILSLIISWIQYVLFVQPNTLLPNSQFSNIDLDTLSACFLPICLQLYFTSGPADPTPLPHFAHSHSSSAHFPTFLSSSPRSISPPSHVPPSAHSLFSLSSSILYKLSRPPFQLFFFHPIPP